MQTTQPIASTPKPPNLNPLPKSRFRESPNNISEHRTMVESRPFARAVDFALLQYQALVTQTVSENPNLASVAGFKLTGAAEFVQTLKTLSEEIRIAPRAEVANLDHRA